MSILLFESEGSKRCEKNRNNKMKIKGVKKMNRKLEYDYLSVWRDLLNY